MLQISIPIPHNMVPSSLKNFLPPMPELWGENRERQRNHAPFSTIVLWINQVYHRITGLSRENAARSVRVMFLQVDAQYQVSIGLHCTSGSSALPFSVA